MGAEKEKILFQLLQANRDQNYINRFLTWRENIFSGSQIFSVFSFVLSDAKDKDEKEDILFKIASFFVTWIDECPLDFFYEDKLLQNFIDWWSCIETQYRPSEPVLIQIRHCMKELEQHRIHLIRYEVEQRKMDGKQHDYLVEVIDILSPRGNLSSNDLDISYSDDIMKIDPKDLALELFIKHFECLSRIPSREFLFQRWTLSKKMQEAPNIVFALQELNTIAHWFSLQIVNRTKANEQCSVIMRIIDVATTSALLRDYHSLMNIVSTLNTAAISKLKNAWALVPESYKTKWEEISVLLNPLSNWKSYRKLISETTECYIPFLGIILSDMLMIDQGNETFTEDNLVNTSKFDLMADTLVKFQSFKKQDISHIKSNPSLQFLHTLKDKTTDNELYRLAQLRVLSQECANKKNCIIKAEFILDIDNIIQLSPKNNGNVVFLTWKISDSQNRRKKGQKMETSRALCIEQTACWSSVFSEDRTSSAQINIKVTLNQDAKTLQFKRKEITLTLRQQAGNKSPGIAKVTLNLAEFAEHNTNCRKTIAMQSKSSVSPLMDIKVKTKWKKFNGKKLVDSENTLFSIEGKETVHVGGLDYLLMTDTEFTDDFSEISDYESFSEGEGSIDAFAPLPEVEFDEMTQEQLTNALADVRNQFRHLKIQFGKVLTQKQNLQYDIDTQTAKIKKLEEELANTKPKTPTTRVKASREKRNTMKRNPSSSKKAIKERILLTSINQWIPCPSEDQIYFMKSFLGSDSSCKSINDLVNDIFKSLLSIGCLAGSNSSGFINELLNSIRIGFTKTCTRIDCSLSWLGVCCKLIEVLQNEENLHTDQHIDKQGLVLDYEPSDTSSVLMLEKELYILGKRIFSHCLNIFSQNASKELSMISSQEFSDGLNSLSDCTFVQIQFIKSCVYVWNMKLSKTVTKKNIQSITSSANVLLSRVAKLIGYNSHFKKQEIMKLLTVTEGYNSSDSSIDIEESIDEIMKLFL